RVNLNLHSFPTRRSSDLISSNGDGAELTPHVRRFVDGRNPHLAMANDLRGYQIHEVRPDQWTTEVKAMDQVQRKGGNLGTFARLDRKSTRLNSSHVKISY